MLKISVQKAGHPDRALPRYQSAGAAGMDLHAAIQAPIHLKPGARCLVPSGLKLAIPKGYEGQIRPRSSLALRHGVSVINSPGTIDSDFRGEVGVVLINHGEEAFVIEPDERIAQIVFSPVVSVVWEPVDALGQTSRGEGGYGSTGR